LLWQVDLGWPPDAHPDVLSLPFLNRTGDKITQKSSRDETEMGRSLTCYYQEQNSLKLGKNCLIYCQINIEQDGEKQRQKLTHLPSTYPLLPRLNSSPSFLTPLLAPTLSSTEQGEEWVAPSW